MAKLIWTEESLAWLRDIGEYVAEQNPQAALKVVEGIYQKTQLLIEHPRIGALYSDISDREVRSLLYGHYRIMYELQETSIVYVLAGFHGAMDIDRLKF